MPFGLDITPEDLANFYSHMGHLEKVNMETYKCPLALMAITQVGKHLMDLDVCTGKGGKGGLCYENTLIENTFLDPTTRNSHNT